MFINKENLNPPILLFSKTVSRDFKRLVLLKFHHHSDALTIIDNIITVWIFSYICILM